MDAKALLSHILHQTRENVEFLVAQKQIPRQDGQDILKKIPSTLVNAEPRSVFPNPSEPSAAANTTNTQTTTAQAAPAPSLPPPPLQDRPVLFRAKALWDHSRGPSNLSFRSGQVICITVETNADWWTGYVQDEPSKKQGLFASDYVERIHRRPSGNPGTASSPPYSQGPQPYQTEKPPTYGGYQPYQPPLGPPLNTEVMHLICLKDLLKVDITAQHFPQVGEQSRPRLQ